MANDSCMSCVFLLLLTIAIFAHSISSTKAIPIFIFGDSSSDVGTNNYITDCNFTSNHAPFGMNYPGQIPTGRWSDGYNTIDYLSMKMSNLKESPQPYLGLEKQVEPDYKQGVNFASASSGLLDTTGNNIHSMSEQLAQFVSVRTNIKKGLGYSDDEINSWISNAVFLLSIGSNDIIEYHNTIKGWNKDMKEIMVVSYHYLLTDNYKDFIEKLYKLGARKFGVISALAMGCCPGLRESDGTCSSLHNTISRDFMKDLDERLACLQRKYDGFKYSLGDTYSMMMNVMTGKSKSGLKFINEACCKEGCTNKTAPVCDNPKDYAFWDDYHPTQAASEIMANALYYGTKESAGEEFVKPVTFKDLVENDNASDDDLHKFDPKIRHIFFRY